MNASLKLSAAAAEQDRRWESSYSVKKKKKKKEAFRRELGKHGLRDFSSRGTCFETLNHSLNTGISKEAVFNYKGTGTIFFFSRGNHPTDLGG